MGDSDHGLEDSDDSEPAWLRQAARASLAGEGAVVAPGATLCEGRFRIERRLGQGGMGVVYAAHDAERGERVALKTLAESKPAAVYRIKQEFRSLADVRHPNLVRLHALFEDGGRWCFTMDLVDGTPLGEAEEPSPPRGGLGGVASDLAKAPPPSAGVASNHASALPRAFAQLAAGIEAIHAADKLHRDLKPGNVLVTGTGHVVILDFGLAADPEPGGVGQTVADGSVSGTPAYMAPEQAAGKPATRASDWYAFGVMLYEALCGRLPFEGRSGEVMALKQTRDPEPPSAHAEGMDAELEALCMQLLARDPARRPDAAAVRAILGEPAPSPSDAGATPATRPDAAPFVGRERELEALRAAYHATDGGKPVRMLVSGLSGVGKSTLCERFLSELSQYGEALVLSGRCYQREQVPYKAFDAVIDALSRHLRKLPEVEALGLLPPNVAALGKLFPALARLPVLSRVRRRGELPPDGSMALKRVAFEALRELFGRLSLSRPVVVLIDDLQWGDSDSARLLAELLAPPEPPALLVLGTFRSDEADDSPMLTALRAMDAAEPLLDRRELSLDNLAEGETRALAAALGAPGDALDTIARESAGHPLFVQVLAHAGGMGGLSQLLEQSIAALDADARTLLTRVALTGRPVTRAAALSAAGLDAGGHDHLDALIAQRLLRPAAGEGPARVLCYHDRVREVAAGLLEAEARAEAHTAWADVYASAPHADDEARVEHLLGAGRPAEAATLAARAAEDAEHALAHELASRLYGLALEHGELPLDERRRLLDARADVLARQERSAECAAVLRELAAMSEPREAERLALEAAVLSPELAESRSLVDATAERLGLAPDAAQAALDALGQRGPAFEARDPATLDAEQLHRLDLLGLLADADGNRFAVPALLEALDAGAARHALSALLSGGGIAIFMASQVDFAPEDLGALLAAHVGNDPELRYRGRVSRAFGDARALGQARKAARSVERAVAELERTPTAALRGRGRTMHRTISARAVLLSCWELSGEHGKLGQALAWERAARERGDTRENHTARIAQYLIAADEPEAARRVLDADLAARAPEAGGQMLGPAAWHDFVRPTRYRTDLYAGTSLDAVLACWEDEAPAFLDASNWIWNLTGALVFIALAAGTKDAGERERHLARAETYSLAFENLESPGTSFRSVFVLHRANLAELRGDHAEARALLEELAREPDPEVGAHQHLPALRRVGELEGGERGEAMIADADARMQALGFKRPDRWTYLQTPAFGDPR